MYKRQREKDGDNYQEAIEGIISRARIPIRALLGKSTISVNDFMNIQIGDIVKLDSRVDDELDVYVGNIMKFRALPGAISDSYAVRVTSVVKEEQ